ncbi:MAG: hypothetical protein H6719_33245 [Sandaracinaceae bacterium]|nr:hypothetical protein [Sandaracinaceae bacterium]
MRPALLASLVLAALAVGCRAPYPAPAPRTAARLSPTQWGRTDEGDIPTIRRAEQQCLERLSPSAVSAAFRAVDDVAEALVDLCSIEIVDDDPLVWHVWCGSDATFQSGTYLGPAGQSVACMDGRAATAFDCIGQILARHLLASSMTRHVSGVEIVSIGSVDEQRLATESAFIADPCPELQRELVLGEGQRWEAPSGDAPAPTEAERSGLWNRRLSWCRAAFAGRELRRGMSRSIGGAYELAPIGAGADWLASWQRAHHGAACPTSPAVSGERARGQCRDARRVDLYVRVRAQQGTQAAAACQPMEGLPGGEAGQALYCYSDCQARAATGRNPQGFSAPAAPADLLFGRAGAAAPADWIVDRGVSGGAVNTASVRQLLLRN